MLRCILHHEMLLGGRRNRTHVFRWLYGGWLVLTAFVLLVGFMMEELNVASTRRFSGGRDSGHHASAPEVVGARFASFFVWQQTLFVFLVVPVFTAGAIIDEKRQGTLQYLLLSDLEARHILLGKLIGRVSQALLWLLAGLPLFAVMAGFGGVEPVTLAFLFGGLVMPVFALAAMSLLASVWCKQTSDAVLAVYAVLVAGGLLVTLQGGVFSYLDPLWVLEPAWGGAGSLDVQEAGRRLLTAAIAWGGLGFTCFALATARLLPVFRREMEHIRPDRRQWFAGDREPMDGDPVRWREQHVEGLAPNAMLRRIPHWLAIVGVAVVTTISSLAILYYALAPKAQLTDVARALLQLNVRRVLEIIPEGATGFWAQGVLVMFLASLVVGIRCAGAFTKERERQTWEAVLLTPMTAKQIVHGKLWGIIFSSLWYLLAYAAPAVSLAVFAGPVAVGYTLVWLGATVLAMYYIGAVGLWCSVGSGDTWRSLLKTLAIGYPSALAVFFVTSPALAFVFLVVVLLLLVIDIFLGTNLAGLCMRSGPYWWGLVRFITPIGLAVLCWVLARYFLLGWAQRWIADRERTRHSYEEPYYRRSRSPLGAGPRR